MKSTIITVLLAIVLFSSVSIPSAQAAGTMQYASTEEIGLALGESIVRYVSSVSETADLEQLTTVIDKMIKEAYYAGKAHKDIEPYVAAYFREFKKAYNQ